MRNLLNKIRDYFVGVVSEMKKVVWPTRSELIRDTIVVATSVVVAAVVIGLVDLGLSKIFEMTLIYR